MRARLRRTGRAAKLARHLPGNPVAASMLAGRVLDREGAVAPIARAGVRGVVGAMAMTGMRQVTTGLGLVKQTPPEAVVEHGARGLMGRVPERHRQVAVELAHWSYGAVGGALFGVLPGSIRRRTASGPVYGILSWLAFEIGIAPLLGLPQAKRPDASESLALAADHVLYGSVVAASGFARRA